MDATLKFSESHEWVKDNGDGTVTMGITDHAQGLLGDVVFVDLPEVGDSTEKGEGFSLVESVAINDDLEDSPELVNDEPFEGGWIAKIKLADDTNLDHLMDADAYAAAIDD